jgi:hypothetical protein
MRTASATIAAAVILAATAGGALAADRLGCRAVGFINDRDVIPVGGQPGGYRSIQLRVSGNDISMRDLKVVYGNGEVDDLAVRSDIRAGGETRWIDLKGNRRQIREIVMTYASRPSFRGQATVCAFGR